MQGEEPSATVIQTLIAVVEMNRVQGQRFSIRLIHFGFHGETIRTQIFSTQEFELHFDKETTRLSQECHTLVSFVS